jgi:GT2 family glycosyltransferase
MGIRAKAHIEKGNVRVTWPASGKKVSIIIPTKDHLNDLKKCLNSILNKTTYSPFEIILVDSSSHWQTSQRYYQKILPTSNISIIRYEGKFNYSAALNLGARSAGGDIFLFLNNDIEVIEADWLEELVRWVDRPEIGVVGAKLLYPGEAIQHAGIVIGMEGHASHIFAGVKEEFSGLFGSTEWYRNYSAVTGACMAIRRGLFESIGGFNESYRLVFSDVEICLRLIRLDYRVVYTPYARLIHREGKTRSNLIPPEDINTAYLHFKDIVQSGDPYFNPNLSCMIRIPTFRRQWEEAPLARLEKIVEFSSRNYV